MGASAWEEVHVDMVWHTDALIAVPVGAIEAGKDFVSWCCSHLYVKGRQIELEEGEAHRGGEMKGGA